VSLLILCPGQGGQTPEMFGRLLADPLTAGACTELGRSIAGDFSALAADPARCFANRFAQPLICLYQMSVWSALASAGVRPAVVAGYSVGELAAWGVAGALSAPDVVKAATERAAAMDAHAPAASGMLAVRGLRLAVIEAAAIKHGAAIAIRNGADHAVLAGPIAALEVVQRSLSESSAAHVVPLPISVPAHSPWLASAVSEFADVLAAMPWKESATPVLAGIDGQPRYRPMEAISTLSRQIAETLEWARVMDVAVEMSATRAFEIGPGNALCRMWRERHPGLDARALDDFTSVAGAIRWLQRAE